MADSPAAEVEIGEALVRDLLREQSPEWADRPLRLVAEGWDNAIWRLGDDLAVRLPRRQAAADLIRHEQQHLPAIGARLAVEGIRTPAPLFGGRPGPRFGWAWSVVPWFEGRAALAQPRPERSAWAARLASGLRALHVPAADGFPLNPVRGVPLRVRDADLRAAGARLARRDPDLAGALLARWADGVAARAHTGPALWLHGDLHPGNIIVQHGDLAAVVDFGDTTGGDPAYDLGAAWIVFDGTGRAAFQELLADAYDDAAWVRARAWAAAMAMILLTRSDDRADMAALGTEIAEQVLQDR
ncbi:aminoglycoside phosphotransferase family protein [Microbacterium sp. 22242]|uniref:aminoglycoside phosphotransferase family protein n=1 Tax=Microbacterium sp. 22242 TaxID=3453896 RepID=UPI003F840B4A